MKNILEDLEILILQNEDDFDRGSGKFILRNFIKEKQAEQLTLTDVSHSKNLKLIQTIENTKQLPQVQYDLQRQLRELRVMAYKLGLYDASDLLKSKLP